MKLSIAGLVDSLKIPPAKVLLPVFEAISNSVQAIEDAHEENGKITIEILRERQLDGMSPSLREHAPIQAIAISDNGIGFTPPNFESFGTGHSTYKRARGGKGLGRFSWLSVFEEAEIQTAFELKGQSYCMQWTFDLKFEASAVEPARECDSVARITKITMAWVRPSFRDHMPKRVKSIIARIFQHHYSLFLRPNAPTLTLVDCGKRLNLNSHFREVLGKPRKRSFKVFDHLFRLIILDYKNPPAEITHRLIFSGCGREVKTEELAREFPGLPRKLQPGDGNVPFAFVGIIEGDILDDNIDDKRLDFTLVNSRDGQQLIHGEIAFDEIRAQAVKVARKELRPFLQDAYDATRRRVETLIKSQYIRYRPLLREVNNFAERIDPDSSDAEIELFLHQEYNAKMLSMRRRGTALALEEPTSQSWKDLQKFVTDANEIGRSELATYVAYRRWILSLLRKSLELNPKTKRYSKEKAVHTLICPMGITSEGAHFEDQNLWVLDERLIRHNLMLSDLSLCAADKEAFDSESSLRPDLAFFDTPHVFVEDRTPHTSVVLIEFKRPERNDFRSKGDNPVDQVLDQVEAIKAGRYKNSSGRRIELANVGVVPFH